MKSNTYLHLRKFHYRQRTPSGPATAIGALQNGAIGKEDNHEEISPTGDFRPCRFTL
jgi:hypothetical protein